MNAFTRLSRRVSAWRRTRALYRQVPALAAAVRNAPDTDTQVQALRELADHYFIVAGGVRAAAGPRLRFGTAGHVDTLMATWTVLDLIRYALEAHRTGTRRRCGDNFRIEERIGRHLDRLARPGSPRDGLPAVHDIADALEEYNPAVANNIGAICPDLPVRR